VNLRIPGPTPCPPEVLAAVGKQMVNHRGPEMAVMMKRVTDRLQAFLGTRNDVLLVSASGTGGLEAAVVNALSPKDRVLGISIGAFGERFAAIADTYGADVRRLDFEWGTAASPDKVREALREESGLRAVLVTHNETSTGVTNPLAEICQVIKSESDALILVDGISSTGSIPVEVDEWGIDILVSGSQKGWAVPPGLSIVAVSPAAWQASKRATMPRFYFDLDAHRQSAAKGQTPWTPTLSVIYGLDVSLERMSKEGKEAIFARHARLGARTRERVQSLGLTLFADERFASNTVTAVHVPEGVDGKELTRALREDYDTVVGGGQRSLAGRIFRIGHLGWVNEEDLDQAIDALAKVLPKLGYAVPQTRTRG
jgi:aspartate aminotransferase-like enzyme